MILIPKNHNLPPLYANEFKKAEEVNIPIKLFNPCGSQTWYLTEYDPEQRLAFGYTAGVDFPELGYVSIEELESVRLPFGLKIERDLHWDATTKLSEVMES